MTRDKAIKKSIKHWRRMIKFAKTRPAREAVDLNYMEDQIGETASCAHCALCQRYLSEGEVYRDCGECPIYKIGEMCFKSKSQYQIVVSVKTWGKFVTEAEKMKVLIEKAGKCDC